MTGIFIQLPIHFRHHSHHLNFVGKGRRVFKRVLVLHGKRPCSRESLGQNFVFSRSVDAETLGQAIEIFGLNHQRISFPIAARIACPEPDIVIKTGAVIQRNNPRVVNHFRHDHGGVLTLDNLNIVVIEVWLKWRPRIEADDASL